MFYVETIRYGAPSAVGPFPTQAAAVDWATENITDRPWDVYDLWDPDLIARLEAKGQ